MIFGYNDDVTPYDSDVVDDDDDDDNNCITIPHRIMMC
jgi:hypothetical protein